MTPQDWRNLARVFSSGAREVGVYDPEHEHQVMRWTFERMAQECTDIAREQEQPALVQIYVIANLGCDEDETEVLPEGWVHLAGIITDLWAYSIADFEGWKSNGGDPASLGWSGNVIDLPAGVYEFTHHTGERAFDRDSPGTVIFAHVKYVGRGLESITGWDTGEIPPFLSGNLSALAKLVLEPHDFRFYAVDGQDLGSSRRVQAQQLGALVLDLEDAINRLEDEPVILIRLIIIITHDAAVRHHHMPRSHFDPARALQLI